MLTLYREAKRIVDRLGSWVLHAVRDAEDLDRFVGFLVYVADGMAVQRERHEEAKRLAFTETMTAWRRAARWVDALDRQHHQGIAVRLLERLEEEARHHGGDLAYVKTGIHHPWLVAKDRPVTRSRSLLAKARVEPRQECPRCGGHGYV
jgi:GNAT superfamily N-acetyltransferase